jgi:hypothetical protein
MIKKKPPVQVAFLAQQVQAKLLSANDQFTNLSRKVSTNLGRMLR